MKKGVSALIATVILVAFTVSAAIIITSFMTGVIKFQTASVSSQAVCAQKGALLIDTAMCTRVRDSSLVGYWKLDSVNTTNYTLDSSGYGNDGKLMKYETNPPTQNFTAGQIGNALQFDGINDYVDAGNAASLNITDAITLSAWVKANNQMNHNGIVWKKQQTFSPDYGLMLLSDETLTFRITNSTGGVGQPTSSNPINNEWHYLVGTYDGAVAILYIDGLNIAQAALSGDIANSGQSVRIGTRDTNAQFFNGTIDEVRIYNRSLSADEIQQHYQKGLEKFAVDGYFKTIKASVRNIGSTPLSNFTIFADINGRLYQNDTPENGGLTLPVASEPLTLQAYTYYDGPIKTLKVSVLNCPISMTMTNDSAAVGTC